LSKTRLTHAARDPGSADPAEASHIYREASARGDASGQRVAYAAMGVAMLVAFFALSGRFAPVAEPAPAR
jgi:hypothetical protein